MNLFFCENKNYNYTSFNIHTYIKFLVILYTNQTPIVNYNKILAPTQIKNRKLAKKVQQTFHTHETEQQKLQQQQYRIDFAFIEIACDFRSFFDHEYIPR